jgi:hypothetical protein
MPELQKRMNSGYVLMDTYRQDDGTTCYFLERGKHTCVIKLEPTGHGWLYTDSYERRI